MTAFSCFLSVKISFASGVNFSAGKAWRNTALRGWISATSIIIKFTAANTPRQTSVTLDPINLKTRINTNGRENVKSIHPNSGNADENNSVQANNLLHSTADNVFHFPGGRSSSRKFP